MQEEEYIMTLSFKQKQNKTHSLVEHCSRANNIAILRDLVLESSLSLTFLFFLDEQPSTQVPN